LTSSIASTKVFQGKVKAHPVPKSPPQLKDNSKKPVATTIHHFIVNGKQEARIFVDEERTAKQSNHEPIQEFNIGPTSTYDPFFPPFQSVTDSSIREDQQDSFIQQVQNDASFGVFVPVEKGNFPAPRPNNFNVGSNDFGNLEPIFSVSHDEEPQFVISPRPFLQENDNLEAFNEEIFTTTSLPTVQEFLVPLAPFNVKLVQPHSARIIEDNIQEIYKDQVFVGRCSY